MTTVMVGTCQKSVMELSLVLISADCSKGNSDGLTES